MENSVQSWHRRFVFLPSLDNFVRSSEHIGGNREADLLGGFEIDDQ
jgi:hypothetical protein